MFGWDACRIARLALRPCSTLRDQLLALGGVPLTADAAAAAPTAKPDRRKAAAPARRKNHSQVACDSSNTAGTANMMICHKMSYKEARH